MKSSIGLTALVGSLMCISPIFGKDKLLGAFKNNFHDIAGNIYSKGDNQLVIEGFTYDGQGPDAFFWVGTKGKEPSTDGIILPHPFEGKFYDNGDRSAPILSQSFDGSQNDLVLTLPDDIEVKDLKWISIWCRRFELTFGDFVFQEHSDGENEVPEQDVVKPQKKPQSSGLCKSNQECIKLRDCPYTKKLLTRVLSSSSRAEKNNMIAEMRKLVCKPSDRSVCCDIEGYEEEAVAEGDNEESEAEAEGDHEESDAEAEGDHEESDAEAEGDHKESDAEAEGDHEESEAEAEGDHEESDAEAEGDHEDSEAEAEGSDHDDQNKITNSLVSHIMYDFPHKVGIITQLAEHKLAGELWAVDEDTLEFRKFTYGGKGPDAFFMIGTHDADEKPNLDDGIPIPYSKDKLQIQKLYDINDEIPKLTAFKNEQFKITLPPGIHVSDLKWLSVYCRQYTKDFGNVIFE